LAAEQERSETLLLSIFPRPIAERLKISRNVIAERSEEVSVVFADITGLTPLAERLPAEEVVVVLDEIFSAFDQLVARHGLEKIKTISDGYLAAAGIPTRRADHAQVAARLALAMRKALAELPVASGLSLRVGIDSGPVVAGVIGRTKFGYDLWGDTVNTASRMESHAPPGEIQVTERTFRRLEDGFLLERRTGVVVKGKGEMTTYVLVGGATGALGRGDPILASQSLVKQDRSSRARRCEKRRAALVFNWAAYPRPVDFASRSVCSAGTLEQVFRRLVDHSRAQARVPASTPTTLVTDR
jgi:class 3 adenylate cyclase